MTGHSGIELTHRASATILFIPYILIYSPTVPENPNDPDSERIPDDEYNTSGIGITLILMALFVDRKDRERVRAKSHVDPMGTG